MSSDIPRKMIIPYIVEVLKKYSDEEHTLSQKEIQDKLKTEFDLDVHRKTLSQNLRYIMCYDSNIQCRTIKKIQNPDTAADGEEYENYTDFYYEPLFTKSELQALIYNVIFAKHITPKYKKDLVKKLETVGPPSLRYSMNHYILKSAL